MKTRTAVVSLLACLVLALPALAQVSSNYDLSWNVIAGSGGRMASPGGHTVRGTAGQPLVGTMQASSGHSLCSGYWCGMEKRYTIFMPVVVRDYAPSTSALIFSDNFNGGTLTSWTPNRGTWTNPGSRMRGEYTLGNAWNIRTSAGSNLAYTGTVNLLSGNAVGLVFRSSPDGTSSYDVILDAVDGALKISKRQPYQVLASYPMTVQRNHVYTIKLTAKGSTLEAYLDGVKRLTVTDTTYTSGQLGVMVFRAAATYDDLEARRLP